MFTWDPSYETGIHEIDDQHQKLFEIGHEIEILCHSYLNAETFDQIIYLLNEITDYTVYHFETEKKYFLEYGYPQAEKHLAEHDECVEYLKSIDFKNIKNNQEEFLDELLKFLGKWIILHIQNSDLKYVPFLKEKIK